MNYKGITDQNSAQRELADVCEESTDYGTGEVLLHYDGEYPAEEIARREARGFVVKAHTPPSEYKGLQNPGEIVMARAWEDEGPSVFVTEENECEFCMSTHLPLQKHGRYYLCPVCIDQNHRAPFPAAVNNEDVIEQLDGIMDALKAKARGVEIENR